MRIFIFLLLVSVVAGSSDYRIENLVAEGKLGGLGASSIISCHATPNNTILWWEKGGENVTNDARIKFNRTETPDGVTLSLIFRRTFPKDMGLYICRAVLAENFEISANTSYMLNITLQGRVINRSDARAKEGADAALICELQGYPLKEIAWRIAKSGLLELLPQNVVTERLNDSHVSTKLQFHQVRHFENGTYLCEAIGPNGPFNATAHLYVLNKPSVSIDVVKAVGANKLYVNWTASDGNEPIKRFFIQTRKNGTNEWLHVPVDVGGGNSSFVIPNLETETAYQVSVKARNAVGESPMAMYETWVPTLSHDPEFIPEVSVKGVTKDSLTIGWTQPRPDVRDFVQFYEIVLQNNDTKIETIQPDVPMNVYMFPNLKAMTTYSIKIAACSEYTKSCGPWSREVNGTTLEGTPEPPENLTIQCRFDNISQYSSVYLTWRPPKRANGAIAQYKVVLQGESHFRNDLGAMDTETYGPEAKTAAATTAKFDHVRPNTNYTVRVAVMTKQRHVGKDEVKSCVMPPTVPDRDKLSRFYWNKVRWIEE